MGRAIGVLGSAKVVNFGVLRGTSVRRVLRSIRCYWEDSGGTGECHGVGGTGGHQWIGLVVSQLYGILYIRVIL